MGVPEGVPEGRCGFTLELEEETVSTEDRHRSTQAVCCWREVWRDTGRCVWHAPVPNKPPGDLVDRRWDGPERLDGAFLHGCDLKDSISFVGCSLRRGDLSNADLTGVKILNADLHGANLRDADLRDAELIGTTFRNADMPGVTLTNADLVRAELPGVDLRGAVLANANLPDACLDDADLRDTDFAGAFFWGASLSRADLRGADLTGVDFREATLCGAELAGIELNGVDLRGANLEWVRLYDADVSNVRLNDGTRLGYECAYEEQADATMLSEPLWSYRRSTGESSVHTGDQGHSKSRQEYDRPDAPRGREGGKMDGNVRPRSPLTVLHRWGKWLTASEVARDRAEDHLGNARWIYRTYQRLLRENSIPDKVPQYYVREMHACRKFALVTGDRSEWLKLSLARWTMLYGESPWRVVYTSLAIIATFTLLYPLTGGIAVEPADPTHFVDIPFSISVSLPPLLETGLVSLYFSIVTFTTLGYGDVQPASGAVQFLAGVESLLGAALIALLVAVLSRRVMR